MVVHVHLCASRMVVFGTMFLVAGTEEQKHVVFMRLPCAESDTSQTCLRVPCHLDPKVWQRSNRLPRQSYRFERGWLWYDISNEHLDARFSQHLYSSGSA